MKWNAVFGHCLEGTENKIAQRKGRQLAWPRLGVPLGKGNLSNPQWGVFP
jgi:hypothetical protein